MVLLLGQPNLLAAKSALVQSLRTNHFVILNIVAYYDSAAPLACLLPDFAVLLVALEVRTFEGLSAPPAFYKLKGALFLVVWKVTGRKCKLASLVLASKRSLRTLFPVFLYRSNSVALLAKLTLLYSELTMFVMFVHLLSRH